MQDLFKLKGKVALVTGGSRGIGAMIARGLVEAGVKTYITARRAEALQATAEALCEAGGESGQCIALAANLAASEGLTRFAEQFAERESKLHMLFNNAGATWGAPLDTFPENGWDKVMDLNVK